MKFACRKKIHIPKEFNIFCFIFLLLSMGIIGCSEQYKIERMIWRADRAADPIIFNEGQVTDFEFDKAISMYKGILHKTSDSAYALNVKLKMAKLYTLKKSNSLARQIYDDVLKTHAQRPEVGALVLFNKAQSFEIEDDWPQALKILNEILIKYPKTQRGLTIPLYIARYYKKMDDKPAADLAYNQAREYYQNLINQYPQTTAAILSENLIINTYLEQNDWQQAVMYLENLDKKYKLGPDTLLVLARVYQYKLYDQAKAVQIYQRFLRDYPKHKMENVVKRELRLLQGSQ